MKTAKRQLNKHDAAEETTKRLESIMASFDAFDADMRIGTRQRREKDEFKVFTMQQQMAVLERSLHNEVKKRTEMTKSIKTWCDTQVEEMRAKFQQDVNERRVKLQERVDGLRERTNDMRRRFTVDMHAIPLDIEARGKALAERLHHTMEQFEAESKSRKEREASMLRRLAHDESRTASSFDTARTERENDYVRLRKALDDHAKARNKRDQALKDRLSQDLARLRNQVSVEQKIRWREDAELAAAMNGYIEKIQQSLYIVNSGIGVPE